MKLYESETVELKEIYTSDLKKEIVAFANTYGGTIYIGVQDSGHIIGVDNADFVMQQISNSIRDSVRPDVSMFVNIGLLQEDKKFFIKVTVSQGTKKPYYLSDKGLKPTGVYVRSGTTSAPASEDAIRMMIKMADGDSFEENRSLVQELTFNKLEEELQKRDLEFTEVQMKNLGILSPDDIYTNMGLLVSDQCKHSIKFAVFQGIDKLVFRDRKEFTGSLFTQLTDAYRTIDFYNGTKATFHDLFRTDERDYPEDAVREALLNAIVHRDYSFSGSTFINLYSDRLEMISLGGLVSGLSLEAAMLGASQPRNEKLAALFYRMKLIEAYGTGISKIISCYKGLTVQPKFENVEGAFRVVLPNIHAKVLSAEEQKYLPVLRLFEKQKEITRSDVEEALGSGTTHAINILKEMLDKDLIRKVGNGRLTRYVQK
ncbi:RNA-binding domain-containing protein [Anaerotignum propionicum]|uniref:ATP-dependent DNA helicase RecG n=1 Tax=Anaerotignum propionicum DSM 1682 TaxID=991789 RepID=A0A0X1U9F5_ANAPI|nr:RNA-binding domain-containing protein [Anaerotignum propionicum]AMJ41574.1 divergent AAA domain protein [Anaerotignum propionicum DSM 1682]SHE86350.1 ATP-dependent DNA helicase RecG [[Clostridium] propionicum DSM 1682] [Anaerotignum propionicum DSM 1682]